MFNQGERKFTAMDPKDDAVVDKMYNPPKQSDTLSGYSTKTTRKENQDLKLLILLIRGLS